MADSNNSVVIQDFDISAKEEENVAQESTKKKLDAAKTTIIADAVLKGQEEYVKKQVAAKLAIEQQDWQLGCKLSAEGLVMLDCEELTEHQSRVRAELLNFQTMCFFKTNQLAKAIKSGEEALKLGRSLFDSSNALLISYADNLGNAYRSSGKRIKAVESYTQVLLGLEKQEKPDGIHLSTTLYKLSLLYYETDKADKAMPLLKQAEPIFLESWENEQNQETFQNYANCVFLLGLVLIQLKLYEAACDNIHSVKGLCSMYPQWKIHEDGFYDKLLQRVIRLHINQKRDADYQEIS